VNDEADFSRLFLKEMFFNVALATLVMVCLVVGTLAGRAVSADTGWVLGGTAAGAVVGVTVARWLYVRRHRAQRP
jgi:hypothetical protein